MKVQIKPWEPVTLIVRCLLTVVSVVTRQFGSLSIYLIMLIQNSLARTVFNTPKTCHITPVLASLHWLKIKERIEYKLFSLTYNILTTSQATYLHNLVSLQSPRGTRSSSPQCPDQNHEMPEIWSVDSQENY